MPIRRALLVLQRLLLALAPRRFRRDYGGTILSDATRQMDEVARRAGDPAAWRHGLASVGDVGRVVAHERRVASAGPWADVRGDLAYALRGFRRDPGFTLTAVLTLALGIGLTSAVFAFADGYLFRPLPFPASERAYYVRDPNARIAGAMLAADVALLRQTPVSRYGLVEWEVSHTIGEVQVAGRPFEVWAHEVSPGFRRTVALPLVIGRDFTVEDHRGGERVAWLAHRFWIQAFGGDPAALGQIMTVETLRGPQPIRVVGVLAPSLASFDLNNRPPDIVMPALPREPSRNRLSFPMVLLPEGTSVATAEQELAAALQSVAPGEDKPRTVRLRSLREAQVAGGRPTARVFLAGALLVMALASINLVHLLLVRSEVRSREVAVRTALGASRWRMVRAWLVESVVLGAVGISSGLALGGAMASLIKGHVPELPTAGRNLAMVPMQFDGRVLAVAGGLGLAVTLVSGLWPAWQALRRRDLGVARGAGGASRFTPRFSRLVLASELTVATVVTVGTAFIGLGIYRYLHQPLGFEYQDRFSVVVQGEDGRALAGEPLQLALEAIRGIDTVSGAAVWSTGDVRATLAVDGKTFTRNQVQLSSLPREYADTWQLGLERGRWFEVSEFHEQSDRAIVDTSAARLLWPQADPVGQSFRLDNRLYQVVGVFRAPRWQLDREPTPIVHIPGTGLPGRVRLVVWNPGGSVEQITSRIQGAVRTAVPGANATVSRITFDSLFQRGTGEARFQAPVVLLFGSLAVVLAGVGIFGLVSYMVERRRREFGVRMAIGASQHDVWRMVVRESVRPAVGGLLLGSLCALALESVVEASVFGWQSSGPIALAVVAVVLLTVAFGAALIPAARATRVDPALTLRTE